MRATLWRFVEWRLARHAPATHAASTLGDLAEDYARRRAQSGEIASAVWLLRETRSLTRAYHTAHPPARLMLHDDYRQAVRRLASQPGIAFLCVVLLALATGLSTAMFSVGDALLLRPAPFREAERLIRQTLFRPEPAVMAEWRASGLFEGVEATRLAPFRLEPETGGSWNGAWATPGLFDLLGVRPLFGRVITAPATTGLPEVMLSETVWSASFGRDPGVLGRRIRVGGTPAIVVGIMPADFRFPEPATQAWASFAPVAGGSGPVTIVGRLRAGVPLADAESRAADIVRRVGYIPRNYRSGTGAPPFHRVGDTPLGEVVIQALWALFGGVALVFVVLCANVNSLLFARIGARRHDFGVCAALGAARARLIRQSLIEHVLIGLAGSGAGVALAWLLTSQVPEAFLGRTLNPIDIDPRALMAASAIGVVSVVFSGVLPAWLGTRPDPMASLKRSGQSATETQTSRTTAGALVVVETALACSLLVGSAFLVQSFRNLVNADRGFDTDGVTNVRLDLDSIGQVPATPPARELGDSLLRNLQASRGGVLDAVQSAFGTIPGVRAIAVSQELPPDTGGGRGNVRLREDSDPIESDGYRVGASFFALYGIRILKGRGFQPGDTDADVVIGERLADLLWPGQDPVGRTFAIGRLQGRRVIGVASEIRLPTLDASLDRPEFYTPLERHADDVYVSVRCGQSCPDEPTLRSLASTVHPGIGVRILASRENRYLEHLRLPRATAQVGGLFAVVAVFTAAGGLFSLLTYAVGRRRREFGIRTALGASPGQMARLVMRDGLGVAAVGLVAGTIGGWFVVKSLTAFHYGIGSDDPVIWSGVIATIVVVSIAAAWRPALSAMRVDPVQLLREE